ncbi:DNA methyltransferase [Mammaliicoccus sciuri]|uniref:DNA methyltransferase n=1 Tax=Mammaliicoccus sciuri TaxID=1296 RepID=UPI003F54D45F
MAKLNDLTGKEWVKSTKSWFTLQSRQRYKTIKHPGKFPEELAEKFILFFSKNNELIFDPFMGVGSTAVAAEENNRQFRGIELESSFISMAENRLENKNNIIEGDSRYAKYYKDVEADFIITSPPYWNMLGKSRGNSNSQHKDRIQKNLDLVYSDSQNDLGNIDDYSIFMKNLQKVFKNCNKILKSRKYMVVVVQNFRDSNGEYVTFAWDTVKYVEKEGFTFVGEQIWCQDNKKLGIWGFPSTFISNNHHHYCLVFRKNE